MRRTARRDKKGRPGGAAFLCSDRAELFHAHGFFHLVEQAHDAVGRLALDDLRRVYHARQVADAASICRDVNRPGLALMGDFWHMTWEETSDFAAFIAGAKWLWHIHIASRRNRCIPGEDGEADNYVDGFRGLKAIGYRHYISFECGAKGPREKAIPAACKLMREQWEQA